MPRAISVIMVTWPTLRARQAPEMKGQPHHHTTGVASTKDIGAGGLYMNTRTELPEGGLLTLRIPFTEGDVVVNAEVVYSNPGRGVGVRFHGLSEKDRALMERSLARSDG